MTSFCSTCPFCSRILNPQLGSPAPNSFDTIIHESNGLVLAPSVGMLAPGHLLLMTRAHAPSFAFLNAEELSHAFTYCGILTTKLSLLFGSYFCFEHGADSHAPEKPYGGCITHAHWHLLPLAASLNEHLLHALPWVELNSAGQLSAYRGVSYALWFSEQRIRIAPKVKIPGQWIRRVAVERALAARHWDWAIDSGAAELRATQDALRQSPL